MRRFTNKWSLLRCIVLASLVLLCCKPVSAVSHANQPELINESILKLVQFCSDPRMGFDEKHLAVLVDYVLSTKQKKEIGLSSLMECTGAYYEFDAKVSFARFIDYSFSSLVPQSFTRPSCVRYSVWTNPNGDNQKLPGSWKAISPGGTPVIIHGLQHDSNTPDLNTGVYHEYDLKRTLILFNYKGRQVFLSISKQVNQSKVGKKGFILGRDNDWNYYYSGEPGTAKTGLGWAKTYIYDFFSIGVYVETSNAPASLRVGHFNWLNAGWLGINFVKSMHILDGLKRFGNNFRAVLESSQLPTQNEIISVYQRLLNMSVVDLNRKYGDLQKASRQSAERIGKIGRSESDKILSFANVSREQMVEELMLEYLKMTLGKPTPLGKQYFSYTVPSS